MMTQQFHLFNGFYAIVLVAVAIVTHTTVRRIAGALVGGAAFGVVALGIIRLGEQAAWWHMAITRKPYFVALLLVGFALGAFIYLITWRVTRRLGWRGLAMTVILAAVIGPSRDYWCMATFPEWGTYGPGPVPVLVIAVRPNRPQGSS
jgi:peptidoglycan/LPS O-acetylase OafA/YrhL